ncbi:MAG: hypothetical protein ABI847_20275 [Anaerolineales bacterium]
MTQTLRGTLLTFDASAWTAAVLLEGSDAETVMPVGEWVPAGMLDAADEVAVLLFGGTNSDDGLVLGPYGAVSSYNYPELAGLADGAVLRAIGAGSAAFGALDLADADAVTGTLPVSYLGSTQTPTFGAVQLGSAGSAATGDVRGSGNLKMAGTVMLGSASAAPGRNVEINYAAPYLKFSGHATGHPFTIGVDGNGFIIFDDSASAYRLLLDNDGGLYLGGATGSSKGIGTLNLRGALYYNGTQVVAGRATGYTNAMTGTKNRATAYATGSITLAQLAERVGALLDDLAAHGLIGT